MRWLRRISVIVWIFTWRTIYPEIPPRVEYKMTAYGLTLMPILYTMQEWGLNDLKSKSTGVRS